MRTLGLVCFTALIAVACTSSDDSPSPTLPLTSAAANAPAVTTTEPTSSSQAQTSDTETTPADDTIVRPVVNSTICVAYSADEQTLKLDEQPLTLFARPSAEPVPVLVVATQTDGPAGPFALIQRFFDRDDTPAGNDPTVISDADVFVSMFDNGNAEATWTLADGSQGYLRARGLDREAIIEIVSALSPRPIADPVPGFDFRSSDELDVVVDQLNTDPLTGSSAGSQCRAAASDAIYMVSAITGDDLVLYAGVIDRPPPVDVGYLGGTVLIIGGLQSSDAPSVADVVNADADTWQQLLDNP